MTAFDFHRSIIVVCGDAVVRSIHLTKILVDDPMFQILALMESHDLIRTIFNHTRCLPK